MGRVASIFRKEIPMLNMWLSFLKILLHTRLHGIRTHNNGIRIRKFLFSGIFTKLCWRKKKVPSKRQIFGFNYKIRNATN